MKTACCVSINNISLAKEMGYDNVELSAIEIMNIDDDNWNIVKNEILSIDIPVLGFNSFCDESNPIIGPNVNIEKLNLYLHKVIKRAAELKCKNIGIGSPKARILNEFSYDKAVDQMKTFLINASKLALPFNINILYEAINPKHCDFQTSTIECYRLLKDINLSNLKLVWDVFHSVNSSEKYSELIEIFDLVGHVHICSWDHELNRYYLKEKDINYLDELYHFLKIQKYDLTISIEAPDVNFNQTGKESIVMLNQILKPL